MRAIVYHGPRDLRFESVADPSIQDAEDALVRVTRAAICGSDLHLYHGLPLPDQGFAVGHEFVGVIEEVGAAVRGLSAGDRVLGSCTAGCGRCDPCRRGLTSGCEVTTAEGRQNVFGFSEGLPGGQAELVRVPFAGANLHPIPEALHDEQALFLTDILPTGYMGARMAEVQPGDDVVVFGCGPVGFFAQRCAELSGAARILAVDPDETRLARARARGYDVVNPARDDLGARVAEWTKGRGADAVIEAVGRPELVQQACVLLRPGGRLSVIGIVVEPVALPFFGGILTKNLTVRSGIVSPQASWPHLIPLVEQGRIDPTEIVTHRLPLSEGVRGYEIFDGHQDDVLKVVLTP